jgi:FtsH-binding integral membrane protein
MNDHNQEVAKLITDGLSVVTVVGTLAGLLPAIAALFTIIWTGIRIYETDTVQRWMGRE